jgi:hypothetical protein
VNSKKCEKCVSFTKDATEIRQPYKHRISCLRIYIIRWI